MASRTLYYFAIGGTGALSVEPLIHLCAAGLGPDRLAVILIDPDAGNPALGRALELIDRYGRVRREFGDPSVGYFRTELIRSSRKDAVWSPLGAPDQASAEHTLESFAERGRMEAESENAAHLFDLLFSPAQQREKLKEGFRGNPSIGSILMHSLRHAPMFRELMNAAKNDAEAYFFAVGSIFGGTGAAALPVVAKLLADAGVKAERIGAALVTPYYALGIPSTDEERDGRLKPDSAKFMSATAAALPTYVGGHTSFGTMYVMGDEQSLSKARKTYSAGGSTQRNDPHFVETFAALAALDFISNQTSGIVYTTLNAAEPSWGDLPLGEQARRELRSFFVASSFFLQYFGTSRSAADEQRVARELDKMQWITDIGLGPEFVRENAHQLNELGLYFESVWSWLWATTNNYVPLRLVSFESPSKMKLRISGFYGSADESDARLPIVEHSLSGYNGKTSKGLFKRAEPDRLDSLAEMFKYYNGLGRQGNEGLVGFLHYLRLGTSKFVDTWYSPVAGGGR